VASVEKELQSAPVKVGFGRESHAAVLRQAGAERIWPDDDRDGFFEYLGLALRPGDVLVIAQPTLFTLTEMKRVSDLGIPMQVPGHEPDLCATYEARRAFRSRKPKAKNAPNVETRGRPAQISPTPEQIKAIVTDWHSDMKRATVVDRAGLIMGQPVKDYWVRDLVIKATGSAARKPVK
jgi:hypothetical protein